MRHEWTGKRSDGGYPHYTDDGWTAAAAVLAYAGMVWFMGAFWATVLVLSLVLVPEEFYQGLLHRERE